MILIAALGMGKHKQTIECPDCHNRTKIYSTKVKRVHCTHCRSYIPVSQPERKFIMLSLVTMFTALQLLLCHAWVFSQI